MPAYLKQLHRLAGWSLILSLSLASCGGGQTTPPTNAGASVGVCTSVVGIVMQAGSDCSPSVSPSSRPNPAAPPSVSPAPQTIAGSCNGTPLTNGPVPNGFGVNGWGYDPIDLDGMKAAGFCWMRTDFSWASIETKAGVYDFSYYDKFLAALEQRGLHPLFILAYNNALYEPAGSIIGENGVITTESERQAFARWAAAAVKRYQGHTIIWELWNEPNPHFTPSQYMALANDAIPAMRQADAKAVIIAPTTSGVILSFLSGVFSQGLLPMINGVSVHPYGNNTPEDFASGYASVKALITQNYANTPIVSSEWGFTTESGMSTTQQGEYLARMLLSNTSLGTVLSVWFCWPSSGTGGYGIFSSGGGAPIPGYQEMQRLTTALDGLTYQRSLTAASGDYILLFSGSGRTMLAAWTTGNTHAVTLPDGKSITLTNDPVYTTP